jgi:uncharacterized protein
MVSPVLQIGQSVHILKFEVARLLPLYYKLLGLDLVAADKVLRLNLESNMFNRILNSPTLVRIIPFAVFVAPLFLQGFFGDHAQYWIYALRTVLGAWLLWLVRSRVQEMRWTFSWEAVVAGILVFVVWVGLDGHYASIPWIAQRKATFNPTGSYGAGSALALCFIAVRTIGSSLVVPPLEEVFYRSFLYRYFISSDFLKIPLRILKWPAFLITSALFAVEHNEWLPGIICGLTYQGLVCRKDRLGDAITAHMITNFLLSVWVITRQAYYFW